MNITDAVLSSAAAYKHFHIYSQIYSRGCDSIYKTGVSCYLDGDTVISITRQSSLSKVTNTLKSHAFLKLDHGQILSPINSSKFKLKSDQELRGLFCEPMQGSNGYIETCYGLLQILTTAYQTHVDHMAPV